MKMFSRRDAVLHSASIVGLFTLFSQPTRARATERGALSKIGWRDCCVIVQSFTPGESKQFAVAPANQDASLEVNVVVNAGAELLEKSCWLTTVVFLGGGETGSVRGGVWTSADGRNQSGSIRPSLVGGGNEDLVLKLENLSDKDLSGVCFRVAGFAQMIYDGASAVG